MDDTDLAKYHPGTLYAIHKTVHSLKAFTFRKIKIVFARTHVAVSILYQGILNTTLRSI